MEILNEIIKMQKEGLSDEDIYNRLRNEGVSPKQIKDAVSQAKIKNAVFASDELSKKPSLNQSIMDAPPGPPMISQPAPSIPEPQGFPPQNEQAQFAPQFPAPSPVEAPQEYQEQYYPQESYPEQYPQTSLQAPSPTDNYEGYYSQTPQGYSDQQNNYYAPQGSVDSQTISEIAEAIVTEKISEFKKEIGDIGYFQKRTEEKIKDFDERLRRIESVIDRLQQAVIDKIGEFGQSTSLIHKDLDNLHGTVSKLMNPLIDNYQELQKLTNRN